jgi:hypothetical protein
METARAFALVAGKEGRREPFGVGRHIRQRNEPAIDPVRE